MCVVFTKKGLEEIFLSGLVPSLEKNVYHLFFLSLLRMFSTACTLQSPQNTSKISRAKPANGRPCFSIKRLWGGGITGEASDLWRPPKMGLLHYSPGGSCRFLQPELVFPVSQAVAWRGQGCGSGCHREDSGAQSQSLDL